MPGFTGALAVRPVRPVVTAAGAEITGIAAGSRIETTAMPSPDESPAELVPLAVRTTSPGSAELKVTLVPVSAPEMAPPKIDHLKVVPACAATDAVAVLPAV